MTSTSAGTQMAICKYCNKHLTYKSSNGTKGLIGHNKICKPGKTQKTIDEFQSRLVGKKSKTDASGSVLATHCFSYEESRKDLVRMIAQHDYPLCIVEHVGFRVFCQGMQPLLKSITRNTAKADLVSVYEEENTKLMQFLGSIKGRIAITTDMFIYVPCPHTTEKLTDVLLDSLLEWNLDRKLSTLTVDNSSTNNCMIDLITEKLSCDGLILGRELFHMRCAAHILNLIVRAGLDSFRTRVEKVRESVSFWTATPKRMETFEQNAKHLGVSCEKKITLDCKTRWNSTYLMLATAVRYKKVFFRLKQREPQYKSLFEENEWALATELCERLKIFYSVTELFSDTNLMVSNMITKFDHYWQESHGVMAMATILDPRFKMKILEFYFPLIYGIDEAKAHVLIAKKTRENIFEQYVLRSESQKSNDDSVPISTQNATPEVETESLDAFFSWNSSSSVACGKTELEMYLEENTLPGSHDFDILAWWKQNGIKYPTS
ncbi:hypothetical protein LXL04_026382 [Taraxacum kok-saghyz]